MKIEWESDATYAPKMKFMWIRFEILMLFFPLAKNTKNQNIAYAEYGIWDS